jgi:hypothetical protein
LPHTRAAKCMASASLSARSPSVDDMGRTVTVYEVTVNNVGSCPLIGATLSVYLPSGSAVVSLALRRISVFAGDIAVVFVQML